MQDSCCLVCSLHLVGHSMRYKKLDLLFPCKLLCGSPINSLCTQASRAEAPYKSWFKPKGAHLVTDGSMMGFSFGKFVSTPFHDIHPGTFTMCCGKEFHRLVKH